MHFFYLDETGDTGTDLENAEQPIFVLGGVTVSDKSWRKATDAVQDIITDFFNRAVPDGFELHAHELVAHQGPFAEHSQEDCNALALALLDVVIDLKHRTHFVAIDKRHPQQPRYCSFEIASGLATALSRADDISERFQFGVEGLIDCAPRVLGLSRVSKPPMNLGNSVVANGAVQHRRIRYLEGRVTTKIF
jgi:Protein of unknown function (DUF3800)